MDVRQPAHDDRNVERDAAARGASGATGDAGPSAGLLGPSIAVGIVFALAGALTGLASNDMPPDADARRREIASMSRVERERLERNHRRFQQASEADRQRLRHLAAVVSRDEALEQTLRNYAAWLNGLSPWQRQEVAASEDDDVRVAVIRRILAEQKRQREEYEREQQRLVELFNEHRNRSIPKFDSRPGYKEWERIEPDELAEAFRPLEESLPAGSLPGNDLGAADRNLEILTAALTHYSARPEFHEEPIPKSVLSDIIAALPDARRRRAFEDLTTKTYGPRFLTLIFVKFVSENWWDEARRERRMPRSRAEIEALVAKLSLESQAEFARLEAQSPKKAFEVNWLLLRAYHDLWMEETVAEFNRRFAELREIYKKLDFKGPFPEPFGGGRSSSPGNRGDRDDRGSRGDDGERRGFGRGGPDRGGPDRGGPDRGRDFNRHDGDGHDRDGHDRDGHDERSGDRDSDDDRGELPPAEEHDEPARAERPSDDLQRP